MSDFLLYLVVPVVVGLCMVVIGIVAALMMWIVLDELARWAWALADRAAARVRYELAWLDVQRRRGGVR